MAVNKNFVVKNGIEVATNLIYTTSTLSKVGIGSTIPTSTLDVAGGITGVDGNFSGIATAATLNVGTSGTVITASVTGAGISVGIGTADPHYHLDGRGSVSTGATALYVYGDARITGDLVADDLSFDDLHAADLYVSGISTLGYSGGGGMRVTPVGTGATVGCANAAGIVTYYGDAGEMLNKGVSLGLAIALG